MFLKCTTRKKDSKEHRYWSIVESERVRGGRVVQRHVLYLGEINDVQHESWVRTIEVVENGRRKAREVALFPADREVRLKGVEPVQVYLDRLELHRPRQWGACWLSCELWELLRLDEFWSPKLRESRKGTRWLNVLKTLTAYRLISPGSEWRLHRQWYRESAMGDLLGEDFSIAEKNTLYRCLDKLVEHKSELFQHLKVRWGELFKASFDVLLYDLTSTYFESNPPKEGLRKFGYSRDKRSDCLQVVIALIVTPEGFPLTYEVLPGNTSDKTTLKEFLEKIEKLYGKANRVWVMDRGIPTEEVLTEMRTSSVSYLVGTPRGKLSKLERQFLELPWEKVRGNVSVKVVEQDQELYVLARSSDRAHKERGMRQRLLKRYWKRLGELRRMKLTRDALLGKVEIAKHEAGRAHKLVEVVIPKADEKVTKKTFRYQLNKQLLRQTRRREGAYLLRSNLLGENPSTLWSRYILLTEVEQAFKELKSDLQIRPIYHQSDSRIEAHIFVAFLAYCLQVTLRNRLRHHAAGLTARAVLEKFAALQMIDVRVPTADGKLLTLSRVTKPSADVELLIAQLRLALPEQPPPRLSTDNARLVH